MRQRPSASILVVALGLAPALGQGCRATTGRPAPEAIHTARPSESQGYLAEKDLPDSLLVVPAPPAPGSAALALDEETERRHAALRGTPRWRLAGEDADLSFPRPAEVFSCAAGLPIAAERTPRLLDLLERVKWDAGLSVLAAKKRYQRPRPFLVNKRPTCSPEDEAGLARSGSYPSGHSAIGWAWALVLAEVVPDRADAMLARGRAFGDSRLVCNVHWASDVAEGRVMGAAVVARLHADRAFLADVAAARAEAAALRAQGREPARDCRAESEILATPAAAAP